MIHLSAFADEISPDPAEQIEVLQGEGIRFIELRSVWNRNVADLGLDEIGELGALYHTEGIRVSAIGSPIGKVPIDTPMDELLRRFQHIVRAAERVQSPYIRLFSFYPPQSDDEMVFRDEVIATLRVFTRQIRWNSSNTVQLLHENEKGIYGESIAHCVDLLKNVGDGLAAILDPANFIQCGEAPYPDAYEALRPWIRYVHVKDADDLGVVTAAGQGAARWPELLKHLRADGYDGFFSLEPHLAEAGAYGGFSGSKRFRVASQAFQGLLRDMGWEWT